MSSDSGRGMLDGCGCMVAFVVVLLLVIAFCLGKTL